MIEPSSELVDFLHRTGLADQEDQGIWTPLAGGVSSDIWKVSTQSGDYCVKRALAQLKVAGDWKAPVERNATEWAFLEVGCRIAPGSIPKPIAHDPVAGLFAMEWFPPDRFGLWKSRLLAGRVDPAFAASVGDLLGRIHAATADDGELATRFATDTSFYALRLEPYFLAAAERNPQVAPQLRLLADRTAKTRRVLVHGDVSPKNILVGPRQPVLLDAEVAWFGDPAFDLAFCLNHLVIKRRILPEWASSIDQALDDLTASYLGLVDWEDPAAVAARAARLLPALALARIDGKSPVEYLSRDQQADLRRSCVDAILADADDLNQARLLLVAQTNRHAR
ncbi:phosphotransferase family protein [Alteraurantiacibacter buctensis]|uniref:Phosphotransferase n=1 Tax=Alteraurantiacibacter buctensis TaxID=1503981 RepID=A0A844YW72_9SPHN|nr:aminoglycoside phosphotransferase family protein [Alteraurantiacibacter buctensis]MXO71799.1 phosphotransferase [Alteraurantiacibacter buctensis]